MTTPVSLPPQTDSSALPLAGPLASPKSSDGDSSSFETVFSEETESEPQEEQSQEDSEGIAAMAAFLPLIPSTLPPPLLTDFNFSLSDPNSSLLDADSSSIPSLLSTASILPPPTGLVAVPQPPIQESDIESFGLPPTPSPTVQTGPVESDSAIQSSAFTPGEPTAANGSQSAMAFNQLASTSTGVDLPTVSSAAMVNATQFAMASNPGAELPPTSPPEAQIDLNLSPLNDFSAPDLQITNPRQTSSLPASPPQIEPASQTLTANLAQAEFTEAGKAAQKTILPPVAAPPSKPDTDKVSGQSRGTGTHSAKAESRMSSLLSSQSESPVRASHPHADPEQDAPHQEAGPLMEFDSHSSESSADFSGPEGLNSTRSQFSLRPGAAPQVQEVHQLLRTLHSSMEKVAPGAPNHIEIELTLQSGEPLRVRLEVRGNGLQSTFRTDSPELRQALEQAWPEFSQRSVQRGLRIADASFEPSSATLSAQNSFDQKSPGHGRQSPTDPEERFPDSNRKSSAPPQKQPLRSNSIAPARSVTLWA